MEQALLDALQVFFAGTPGADAFAAQGTINNNETPVIKAPVNFLQIWADDIKYAAGYGGCKDSDIMTTWSLTATMSCYKATTNTVNIGSKSYTAQQLLVLAAANIPTAPVTLPLYGYAYPSVPPHETFLCQCDSGLVSRNAFQGGYVCVTPADKSAAGKTSAYAKGKDDSDKGISYGVCQSGFDWRQAYMGDYPCVSHSEQKEVAADNKARNYTCRLITPPRP